jgi:hypothetical protein
VFAGVGQDAMARGERLITQLALAVEAQAKKNASNGSHQYGTPTPAKPGQGPAVISGTLRRSITHTKPEFSALKWTAKVGMAGGVYPPYGKSPTVASKYAFYLENKMLRGGVGYPFLAPAARMACAKLLPGLGRQVFGAPWSRQE